LRFATGSLSDADVARSAVDESRDAAETAAGGAPTIIAAAAVTATVILIHTATIGTPSLQQ
jgi:hypothetical protein